MRSDNGLDQLGRRERQIMSIVYRLGSVTVAQVRAELEEPLSYSGVRGMLRHLTLKGFLTYEQQASRYLYSPVLKSEDARHSALHDLVKTFFRNSPSSAIAALLTESSLSEADYLRLSKLLEDAREGEGTS